MGKKEDNGSDIKKNPKNEDKKQDEEEIIPSVSYLDLYKYSTRKEKILIVFGIIGSVLKGGLTRRMVQGMSLFVDLFVKLTFSITVKNIIQKDDNIITSLIEILSKNSNLTNNPDLDLFINTNGIPITAVEELLVAQSDAQANAQSQSSSGTSDLSSLSSLFMTMDEYYDELYDYILYFSYIGIVTFVATYIANSFLSITAFHQVTRIRILAFQAFLRQDVPWHEKTNSGELSALIVSNTATIEDGIGLSLSSVLESISTFGICIYVAFTSGWKLALTICSVIPVLLIVIAIIIPFLSKNEIKKLDVNGKLNGIAQEAFSQIRTIVSFGTEQKEIDRYTNILGSTRRYGFIGGNLIGLLIGLITCIIYSSFSLSFIIGSRLINNGDMKYSDVVTVFMGLMMGILSVTGIAANIGIFSQATGAAAKVFHIINREPLIKLDGGLIPDKPLEGYIEFQDVRFNYPTRPEVEILKGISFKCSPGQTVAFAGLSGSGKSTVIQLLERFYNKKSGRILIDGRDIEEYNVKWLRSQLGLVSQEPTLFNNTVAKNISIMRPNATQEEIENAAKLANAHDFILKLSEGYETNTGERGSQMSGGQKQRLCIARALITNPKILLLDEATSALDNKSEKVVQEALDKAASGRTTIVIAHRLSTIRNADIIIVMVKGVITECGNHDELMKLKKNYYTLVKNQEIKIQDDEEQGEEKQEATEEKEQEQVLDSEEEEEAIDKFNFQDNALVNYKKDTSLNKILVSVSMSLPNFIPSTADLTKGNTHKKFKIKNMPWKEYLKHNKPQWFYNFLGFFGSLLNSVLQPVFSVLLSEALNTFNNTGQELLDAGMFWGLMLIVFGAANLVVNYIQTAGFTIASEYLTCDLRKLMYNNIIRQEVGFFDSNTLGDNDGSDNSESGGNASNPGGLSAKLTTESEQIKQLNTSIGSVIQQVFTFAFSFAVAFFTGWKLTTILLSICPILLFDVYLNIKSMETKNMENRKLYESCSKVICESINNVKTVYSLNLHDYCITSFNEKVREPVKRLDMKMRIGALAAAISALSVFIPYIIGYYFGGILIEKGDIDFNCLFRILLNMISAASAFSTINAFINQVYRSCDAYMHVKEIIDRKTKIDASDPNGIKLDSNSFKGCLEFRKILFSYPSRPKVTILNMTNKMFTIPAGKTVAFVGGSGCGKSTIIGLILRWYDLNHGTVSMDGKNIKDLNLQWYRKQIGIVNQEPCLFNISIKENIKYGKLDATDEEVYEAAKKANIHDFIMSLPEKYDTLVGGLGTTQMSGGQKQRVAIARALIRNPSILLLDEATSALDAESEVIVQQSLDEASKGRTTITIAHRLSTIKDADIIYLFSEGKIIEYGTHNDLIQLRGEYYNMVLAGEGQKGIEKTNNNKDAPVGSVLKSKEMSDLN